MAATEPLPLVAIDPGHGGAQPGARGVCGLYEKDLALAVSQELAGVLSASGRARVLLTRTSDETVPLEERARRANAARASLFVSIHGNASSEPTSRGIEVYFLSTRNADRRAQQAALRENEGMSLALRDADPTLALILQGLVLNASHHESQRLALRAQEALATRLNERGRGVLQAPFVVLSGARMAAVLVEVGFLTHADECRLLADTAYQRTLAQALAEAILVHLAQEPTVLAATTGGSR